MKTTVILRAIGVIGTILIASACQVTSDGADTTGLEESSQSLDAALRALPDAEVVSADDAGVPVFLRGTLGRMNVQRPLHAAELDAALRPTLEALSPAFRADASGLFLKSALMDRYGDQHVRFGQRKNGLEVLGAELIVHLRGGEVIAANGHARDDLSAPEAPQITAEDALLVVESETALLQDRAVEPSPRLAYRTAGDKLDLVYVVRVTGVRRDGTPVKDDVLVDAESGFVAGRIPYIHTAKDRELHTAQNGTTLPGPVRRVEGGPPDSDPIINTNYDLIGTTYDCYFELFGRDSFDNGGAKLVSSVHYDTSYVNAFWDGVQMVYGDGDGVLAGNLATSMDVTAHELTHAVTQYTSNLVYAEESGGLNEAMSDIFAATCEWFRDGKVVSPKIYLVGDDVWTPGTPGDALRYMNNPALDGASLDYYPDYSTGVDVHFSSGIANLAFYLLAQGGTHPQGKTGTAVAGIGIAKAAQIFYYANTVLMTPDTTFLQAKTYTEQAASLLGYSSSVVKSVSAAWKAVGVGMTSSPACAHDKCVIGVKLCKDCDPCVKSICAVDPFCCNTAWDSVCVGEVTSVCGKSCK